MLGFFLICVTVLHVGDRLVKQPEELLSPHTNKSFFLKGFGEMYFIELWQFKLFANLCLVDKLLNDPPPPSAFGKSAFSYK